MGVDIRLTDCPARALLDALLKSFCVHEDIHKEWIGHRGDRFDTDKVGCETIIPFQIEDASAANMLDTVSSVEEDVSSLKPVFQEHLVRYVGHFHVAAIRTSPIDDLLHAEGPVADAICVEGNRKAIL